MSLDRDFLFGMYSMGLSPEKSLEISRNLAQERLPKYLLEKILSKGEELNSFESTPWPKDVFYEVSEGFNNVVESESIFNYAKQFFNKKGQNIDLMVGKEYINFNEKVARLIELYSLSQLKTQEVQE